MAKRMLSSDDILQADDLKETLVEIPEWGGGWVKVRELTAHERGDVESSLLSLDSSGNAVLREGADVRKTMCNVVRLAALNENGTKMFANENDVRKIGGKNPIAVRRIYDAVMDLSVEEDVEEGRDPGEGPGDESSVGPAESSPPTTSP